MDSSNEDIFEQDLEAIQNFIIENENGTEINVNNAFERANDVVGPVLEILNNFESIEANNAVNVIDISDSPPVQRILRSRLIHGSPTVQIQPLIDIVAAPQIIDEILADSTALSFAQNSENNQNNESPIQKKKRRRSSPKTQTAKEGLLSTMDEDEDDGSICPICLEQWEMSGTHRLVSLKCGHLFGHSCIHRWIAESQGQQKCCPSCKTRAVLRDFRFLYAKKLCAVDRSEEYRLKNELQIEKAKVIKLKTDYCNTRLDLELLQKKNTELQLRLKEYKEKEFLTPDNLEMSTSDQCISYKLHLEKNILLSKDAIGGCRVMIFGKNSKQLFLSQKSTTEMFAGYGIRNIDTNTFKPLNFVHISSKTLRDLSLNSTQDIIAVSAMDPFVSIYNVRNRVILRSNAPNTLPIWSSCFDASNVNLLYLGQQNGKTHIYDLRNSGQYVNTIEGNDLSPVINIFSITPSTLLAYGGLIVCTLQNLWLYEFSHLKNVKIWKLNISGPFISMQYNDETLSILVTTRPNSNCPQVRFIVGCIDTMIHDFDLTKLYYFRTNATFDGSKIQTIMTRSTQININSTTIVAGYMQDYKHLSTWSVNDKVKLQSLPINETVLDLCSMNFGNGRYYCGALSDNRLRLYKVNTL